jgi:hypothetical protein
MQSERSQILQHIDQVATQEGLSTLEKNKPNAFGVEALKYRTNLFPAEFVPSLVEGQIAIAAG